MNRNDKSGLIGLLVIIVFATGFIIKACNYNAEKEKEREIERIERENHFNSLIDSLASVNIDSTLSSADTIKEPTSQPVPQTSTPNPNSQTDKTDEREHEAYSKGMTRDMNRAKKMAAMAVDMDLVMTIQITITTIVCACFMNKVMTMATTMAIVRGRMNIDFKK